VPAIKKLRQATSRPGIQTGARELLQLAERMISARGVGNAAFSHGDWAAAAASYTQALQARQNDGLTRYICIHIYIYMCMYICIH